MPVYRVEYYVPKSIAVQADSRDELAATMRKHAEREKGVLLSIEKIADEYVPPAPTGEGEAA